MGSSFRLPPDCPEWDSKAMDTAISAVGSSAPGPDGIPYECYSLVPMTAAILKEVAAGIYAKGLQADIPGDFNYSCLFCLPKKSDYIHPVYGEVYKCESTRPLSVVDTSNRLLALAFKICLHDYLESWISKAQQGFLNGRSMYRNILEMDYLSKIYSFREEKAALILFDFKAAFPSVCQEYVWLTLEALGLPPEWIQVIRVFYKDNRQFIGRVKKFSFQATRGIRQGRPLSRCGPPAT